MKKAIVSISIASVLFGWAATAFAVPGITVITPNGGETLSEGSTYLVRWTTADMPSDVIADISVVRSDGATEQVVAGIPLSAESYLWDVSVADFGFGFAAPTWFGVPVAHAQQTYSYKVRISSGSMYDESDSGFTINPAQAIATPALTPTNNTATIAALQEQINWLLQAITDLQQRIAAMLGS